MHFKTSYFATAALSSMLIAGACRAAEPATQRIEPSVIQVGEAARLTISESGNAAITPPMVAGLEFVATTQSQRMESINGVSSTTTSVTYEVVPQQAGVFTIPGVLPGAQPVVLTVNPGNASASSQSRISPQTAAPSSGALPAGATRLTADGAAFVRLRLSKHELYVGETVPVDIQVGMRDGLVASLNGLPTLNGDAFTLNKLSTEPVRSETVVDGKPFTVLTWHSALAAVKPGTLSLSVETPLTVRMRTAARIDPGLIGGAGFGDLLNDPMFQNFFGASTEKEVTVASAPVTFSVLALPAEHRPADFSGAVGHFTVSGGISEDKTDLGDPITVRMRVSGEGSFDRVNSPMLHEAADWKTYAPTAVFKADDEIGYRGEKTFEQPLIATAAGTRTVPEISFSWFDPTAKRYVEGHTAPLTVSIAPAPGGAVAAQSPALSPAQPAPTANSNLPGAALRADHVENGRGVSTLLPYYYQPAYLAAPTAVLIAMIGSLIWMRRRERQNAAGSRGDGCADVGDYLKRMDDACIAHDPELFFRSARAALQASLADRWRCAPTAITRDSVEARLGSNNGVSRVFEMADEAAYSGIRQSIDFARWKALIQGYLSDGAFT